MLIFASLVIQVLVKLTQVDNVRFIGHSASVCIQVISTKDIRYNHNPQWPKKKERDEFLVNRKSSLSLISGSHRNNNLGHFLNIPYSIRKLSSYKFKEISRTLFKWRKCTSTPSTEITKGLESTQLLIEILTLLSSRVWVQENIVISVFFIQMQNRVTEHFPEVILTWRIKTRVEIKFVFFFFHLHAYVCNVLRWGLGESRDPNVNTLFLSS